MVDLRKFNRSCIIRSGNWILTETKPSCIAFVSITLLNLNHVNWLLQIDTRRLFTLSVLTSKHRGDTNLIQNASINPGIPPEFGTSFEVSVED